MTVAARAEGLLPLEPGDNLTANEFLRRYEAMPDLKKAELIEGVVYMPSPLRWNRHATPHADLLAWMGLYRAHTKGVRAGDNATLRLGARNVHQPDAMLIIEPSHGGRTGLTSKGYLKGGPELAAQVSASTVSLDLHQRLRVFQRHHVQEYLVWRVLDRAIDWFHSRGNKFDLLSLGQDGVYHSKVFPGLWLDVPAMLEGDMIKVLHVLRQGIESPEHAKFVKKLQDAAKKLS